MDFIKKWFGSDLKYQIVKGENKEKYIGFSYIIFKNDQELLRLSIVIEKKENKEKTGYYKLVTILVSSIKDFEYSDDGKDLIDLEYYTDIY